jgi:hypothetical protein
MFREYFLGEYGWFCMPDDDVEIEDYGSAPESGDSDGDNNTDVGSGDTGDSEED